MAVESATLESFTALVGAEAVRAAGPDDAIDGIQPKLVVEPATVEESSAILKRAHAAGVRVAPRGGGTRMGWGNVPTGVDLILSTRRMDRLIEHAAGDMTATVQAGMTLQALQDELARAGQMLALDVPFADQATVGGLIATNDSGPLRLRYGGIRDMLIGVLIVRADGVVAHGGGKVVKNVAGYDLPKLFTGALGTLGLIAEATFRLYPRPAREATLALRAGTPEIAGALILDLLGSTVVPTGLALHWAGDDECGLLLRFGGIAASVEARMEQARALAEGRATPRVLGTDEAVAGWRASDEGPWGGPKDALVARCGVLPTEIPATVRALQVVAKRRGLEARAAIQAHGLGLIRLQTVSGFPDDEALIGAVDELRQRIAARDGTLVVLAAPLGVKCHADVWGPPTDTLPLMRQIKARFDPRGILNPGRFVGEHS